MYDVLYKLASFFIWAAKYDSFRAKIEELAKKNPYPFKSWFGPDGRTYIPFVRTDLDVDEEVEKVLSDNGYTITDWIRGHCSKNNRTFSIGKVLEGLKSKIIKELKAQNKPEEEFKQLVQQKTKHLTDAIKSFTTSPSRVGVKNSELNIVISQNPHDVATMSTDRGWTSCMELGSGAHHTDIYQEVSFGGLVAYLINANDRNITKPLARIAIKRFVNEQNDSVAIPEEEVYGNDPGGFFDAVKSWLNTKQHINVGMYRRVGGSYSDTFGQQHFHIQNTDQAAEALATDKYIKDYKVYDVMDNYYDNTNYVELQDRSKTFSSREEAEQYVWESERSEEVSEENDDAIRQEAEMLFYKDHEDEDPEYEDLLDLMDKIISNLGRRFTIKERSESNKRILQDRAYEMLADAATKSELTEYQKKAVIKYLLESAANGRIDRVKSMSRFGKYLDPDQTLAVCGHDTDTLIRLSDYVTPENLKVLRPIIEKRKEVMLSYLNEFVDDFDKTGKITHQRIHEIREYIDLISKVGKIPDETYNKLFDSLKRSIINSLDLGSLATAIISHITTHEVFTENARSLVYTCLDYATNTSPSKYLLEECLHYIYNLGINGREFIPVLIKLKQDLPTMFDKHRQYVVDQTSILIEKVIDAIEGTGKFRPNSFGYWKI